MMDAIGSPPVLYGVFASGYNCHARSTSVRARLGRVASALGGIAVLREMVFPAGGRHFGFPLVKVAEINRGLQTHPSSGVLGIERRQSLLRQATQEVEQRERGLDAPCPGVGAEGIIVAPVARETHVL